MDERQALVWSVAWVIPVLVLAYQLLGGTDYLHVEALDGLLAIDGLLLLIIAMSPRSNDSLFSRVRNDHRDSDIITIMVFLSTLLLINGLFDLKPSENGSGLIAGIGTSAGEGVATLVGVFLLLVAMFALFLFMAIECLAGTPENSNDQASGGRHYGITNLPGTAGFHSSLSKSANLLVLRRVAPLSNGWYKRPAEALRYDSGYIVFASPTICVRRRVAERLFHV